MRKTVLAFAALLAGCTPRVTLRLNGDGRVVAGEQSVAYIYKLPEVAIPPPVNELKEGEVVMVRVLYVSDGEPFDVVYYRREGLRYLVRGEGQVGTAERMAEWPEGGRAAPGDRETYDRRVREICSSAVSSPSRILREVLHRREPIFDEDVALILHHVCSSPDATSADLQSILHAMFARPPGQVPLILFDRTSLILDVFRHPRCDAQALRLAMEYMEYARWEEGSGDQRPKVVSPSTLKRVKQLVDDLPFDVSGVRLDVLRPREDRAAILEAAARHTAADDVALWIVARGVGRRPLPPRVMERILLGVAGHPKTDEQVRAEARSAAKSLPRESREAVLKALEAK